MEDNGKDFVIAETTENRRYIGNRDKYNKSNCLISSVYKSTLTENRVLAVMLNRINQSYEDPGGNIVCEIKTSELKSIIGLQGNGLYDRLEETAQRLTGGRSVGFSDPENQTFIYAPLITLAKMKNGVFTIKFNSEMKKYLKNIKKQYTELKLSTMLSFESVYTFRLYELLRSHCYHPKGSNVTEEDGYQFQMDLSELKLQMGVVNSELSRVQTVLLKTGANGRPDYDLAVEKAEERMYEKYSKFRERCLEPSIKEINDKTEMEVSFTPIKVGRGGKTTGIRFLVMMDQYKHEDQVIMAEDELFDAIRDLIEVKLKTAEVRAIAKAADNDFAVIQKAVAYTNRMQTDNYVGYLLETIKNRWYLKKSSGGVDKEALPDENDIMAKMM